MGLNYESLFNCAPGAYSIVYLINKSIHRRTESNDELLNGIMNPLGRIEDIYRMWCGSMLNLHIRLVQYWLHTSRWANVKALFEKTLQRLINYLCDII